MILLFKNKYAAFLILVLLWMHVATSYNDHEINKIHLHKVCDIDNICVEHKMLT